MKRVDAANEIKSRIKCTDYLSRSKGRLYCCPFCGSGESGRAGSDGALEYFEDSNRFKCHACGEHGSVIDLHMQKYGVDFNRAVDELAAELHINIAPGYQRSTAAEDFDDLDDLDTEPGPTLKGKAQATAPAAKAAIKEPEPDYTDYITKAVEALEKSPEALAYLKGRGISQETAGQWCVGYDPAWISPTIIKRMEAEGKSWRPDPKPVIIIPSTTRHYVARDIRPDLDATARKYAKMNEGTPGITGIDDLATAEGPVFVCEGAFDALSFLEVGQQAIALNSTSNADQLIKRLEKEPTAATLILCLDNDDPGRRATESLREGLNRLNISFVVADVTGQYKDPNERLTADKEGFKKAIEAAINTTAARPDNVTLYIDTVMADDIKRRREIGIRPTGFSNLDKETGGGLRPGLYLIGANSSLGKTTFCSQLADGLAENGADVLYFSLEQSRLEMVSKSIARETARMDMKTALSSGRIMDGRGTDRALILEAAKRYKERVGDRVSIIEGGFNCDTAFITDYVRRYYKQTGKRPVCVIDYLQVLQSGEVVNARRGAGTRELIEEVIKQLVLLKRDLDLTIICIVSLNRNAYMQKFAFESIKETGLAEYSGDVVWGLELQALYEPLFDEEKKVQQKRERIKAAYSEIPRKIRLTSLKHRGQRAVYACCFTYYPQFDLFIPDETTDAQRTQDEADKRTRDELQTF